MEEDNQWSEETYTLEQITKFKFPCEIRMTEGFYDEGDESEDTFSAGDVITIGEKQTIVKVKAKFTNIVNEASLAVPDYDYVKLTGQDEILLPMNYKGTLRVIRHLKKFQTVRELAEDSPRYAKVCESFKLRNEDNVSYPIFEGTVIELVRINKGTPGAGDELIVRHKYKKQVMDSSLPFDMKKDFEAIPDVDDYTLEEAIKRYKLPLLVRFNDVNAIRKAYGDGKKITDTLRLEEKVTQGMLFGNCKLIEGEDTPRLSSGEPQKGAPIVLPLTNPAVRSIEVHVRPGCSSDYEDVAFLFFTDGSLYEDYATFSSKIKRLRTETGDTDGNPMVPPRDKPINKVLPQPALKPKPKIKQLPVLAEGFQHLMPPPVPVRPKPLKSPSSPETYVMKPESKEGNKPETKYDRKHKKEKEKKKKKTKKGDSPEPAPVLPPKPLRLDSHKGVPLPPVPGSNNEHGTSTRQVYYNEPATSPSEFTKPTQIQQKEVLKGNEWSTTLIGDTYSKYLQMEVKEPTPDYINKEIKELGGYELMTGKIDKGLSHYESIPADESRSIGLGDYEEIDLLSGTQDAKQAPVNRFQAELSQKLAGKGKPVIAHAPKEIKPRQQVKPFLDLTCEELFDRFKLCGLHELAKTCKEETLDGKFFESLSVETLRESFELSALTLAKVLKMRDSNWVPT